MAAGSPVSQRNGRATASRPGTVLQGVAVAGAAGANPTQAEYLALLTSLRNAGIIAT
jgi:hypothetical protein